MRPLVLLSGLAEGGAERVAVALLAHLAARGRPVAACTLTSRLDGAPAERLAAAGVQRFDLGARRLLDPVAAWRFVRLLSARGFDLVHAHGQDASLLAAMRRLRGGPRLVVTRHVLDEPASGLRPRLRARLTLAALRRADRVVAVSAATAERLGQLGGPPAERVEVLPNGIELERFRGEDLAERGKRLRSELGVSAGELMILCPAVLREGKGHEQLIDSVTRLRGRGLELRLVLAGAGPREEELRARAAGAGEGVQLLGARDDVPELLAACDLVALASRSEALPTALIEAAAAGRPAVATDVGGTREVVADGETGRLVPLDDPAALDGALEGLASDAGLRERMGRAALRRARELFSIETQAEKTWELWQRVVAEGT